MVAKEQVKKQNKKKIYVRDRIDKSYQQVRTFIDKHIHL
jgi:hypothetical protein